ncbi:MAG: acyl carrier protein [Blautia sp.]|nr:acyl carrier protein [Blautia sp.]
MLKKVTEVIEEKLNAEGMDITEETSFKDDLNADSLDLFELVMALEDEFGIEIPSEDLERLNTVGDVLAYLKSRGIEE